MSSLRNVFVFFLIYLFTAIHLMSYGYSLISIFQLAPKSEQAVVQPIEIFLMQ